MNIEEFVVALQSQFVQDDSTAALLKLVGNVTDGVVKTFEDDGATQKVTAKAGIARVHEIPVPNPVVLAPFRTFVELDQPASKFIFRMRSGVREPTCALFEADGGAWRNEAILRISSWLENKLPAGTVILA